MQHKTMRVSLRFTEDEIELIDTAARAFGMSRAVFIIASSLILARIVADRLRSGDVGPIGESGIKGRSRRKLSIAFKRENVETVDWAVGHIAGCNRWNFMRSASLSSSANVLDYFDVDMSDELRTLQAHWLEVQPRVDLVGALSRSERLSEKRRVKV